MSHPGCGPWWTCSCCWHEGEDKKGEWRTCVSKEERTEGRCHCLLCTKQMQMEDERNSDMEVLQFFALENLSFDSQCLLMIVYLQPNIII